MHTLDQFFSKPDILRNGQFKTAGSVSNQTNNHILCYAANLHNINLAVRNPAISCIITTPDLAHHVTLKGLAISPNPDFTFFAILNKLIEQNLIFPTMTYGIDPTAIIHTSAMVSEKAYIGKNVFIGRNTIINDYSILEDDVIIGDNVIIGNEGFFFKRTSENHLYKVLHAGGVKLEQGVEIMSNSIIQRAHDPIFTVVGKGSKISVNVNIGHSCVIGKHCAITGNVQIAGRTTVGDYCRIGMSATIADGLKIGDRAEIKIGSIVATDIGPDQVFSSSFALPHKYQLRQHARNLKLSKVVS